MSRIYGKIKQNRIGKEYQLVEAEEPAGFHSGISSIDHIFFLTQIIERKTARDQEIPIALRTCQKHMIVSF